MLWKVESFLRALWSFARHGDALLVEHDRRQAICLGCEHLRLMSNGVFCNACECPPWAVSDLRTKWRMRDLKCPKDKW